MAAQNTRLALATSQITTTSIRMFDAVGKALSQLFTPALRAVLMKAVGLSLALIILIGFLLHRLLFALAQAGADWAEQASGYANHAALSARFATSGTSERTCGDANSTNSNPFRPIGLSNRSAILVLQPAAATLPRQSIRSSRERKLAPRST